MSDKTDKVRVVLEIQKGSKIHEMLEDIKDEKGYKFNTVAFYDGLSSLHRKMFAYKYYGSGKKRIDDEDEEDDSGPSNIMDAEKRKAQRKAAKERVEHERLLALAHKLDGTVVKRGTGAYFVKYYTYSGKNRYAREIPLDLVDETLIAKQYYPSREIVDQFQKEGKINYVLDNNQGGN